jgi:hypothetical protein
VRAGKSIQSQEGTERCLTRPDGETRVGARGRVLSPAPSQTQEKCARISGCVYSAELLQNGNSA